MITTVWIISFNPNPLLCIPYCFLIGLYLIRLPEILTAYNLILHQSTFILPDRSIMHFRNVRLLKSHQIPSLFHPDTFHPVTGLAFISISRFILFRLRTYNYFQIRTNIHPHTDFYPFLLDTT